MNVLRAATIVMRMLHAQIRRVHLTVLVMLATQGMGHIVKVSFKNVVLYLYFKHLFFTVSHPMCFHGRAIITIS